MAEKHFPLDRDSITELDGQLYVPESKVSTLVGQQEVLPVYFVSTSTVKIFHDSPVMGAMEYGPKVQDCLKGPFLYLEQAAEILEERKKQVDTISYNFLGRITTKPFPLKGDTLPSEIPVYRYYKESCKLCAGNSLSYPKYNVSNEQVKAFYQLIEERARQRAVEIKDFKDKGLTRLLAILKIQGNCFVELQFDEGRTCNELFLHSFSDERQYHSFDSEFLKLGIDKRAFKVSTFDMLSFSPLEFSIDYDSLDNMIKKHDLIF